MLRKMEKHETCFDHFYSDWFKTIAIFKQTL